jgi:nuclear protein localization family protein 4
VIQITYGFPVEPSPLFLTNNFPVENRPGLHDQSMEGVIARLSSVLSGSDLEVSDPSTWPPRIKTDVGKWLSDWHLVTYLCNQGLFSSVSVFICLLLHSADMNTQDEQKLLCRAATAHAHTNDIGVLDKLFSSNGWLTLLTITESSAPPSRSNGASNGRSETPLAAFEGMGITSPADTSSGGGSGGGGPKTCPHCTFVNENGGGDCEICGLPLSG